MNRPDAGEQARLLDLARQSIEAAVCGRRPPSMPESPGPAMGEPSAAFVTLHEKGELRGCIGLLRFEVPLWENVRDAAAAAALDDPRFMAVRPDELPSLELEISVLDPPTELPDPDLFEPGRHGIVIERGMRRGLLLPQVAPEMGWGAREMLEGVCRKAGLDVEAWRDPASRLYVFESFCFSEPAPRPAPSATETSPLAEPS